MGIIALVAIVAAYLSFKYDKNNEPEQEPVPEPEPVKRKKKEETTETIKPVEDEKPTE